ncbi:MAG: helix-turn-helix domain-containing protein [Crocinitomicaceae bacterium]|nr:helix-turn-helix domain-containing protein [Crocinitomicaceae bacterium]
MVKTREEYDNVMKKIEGYIRKSTKLGGFENLSKKETSELAKLSLMAEEYEDSIPLMPIKAPSSIAEMIRFKMYERNLKQKQLAKLLGISEPYISGLLSGKRKLSLDLAKRLHQKLGVDADFILTRA